jgi:hypothetical protein
MTADTYSKVLIGLYERIDQAIEATRVEFMHTQVTAQDFRLKVSEHFARIAAPFLLGLPAITVQGAPITLKDYGAQNRDYLLREIEGGNQALVERRFNEFAGRSG